MTMYTRNITPPKKNNLEDHEAMELTRDLGDQVDGRPLRASPSTDKEYDDEKDETARDFHRRFSLRDIVDVMRPRDHEDHEDENHPKIVHGGQLGRGGKKAEAEITQRHNGALLVVGDWTKPSPPFLNKWVQGRAPGYAPPTPEAAAMYCMGRRSSVVIMA